MAVTERAAGTNEFHCRVEHRLVNREQRRDQDVATARQRTQSHGAGQAGRQRRYPRVQQHEAFSRDQILEANQVRPITVDDPHQPKLRAAEGVKGPALIRRLRPAGLHMAIDHGQAAHRGREQFEIGRHRHQACPRVLLFGWPGMADQPTAQGLLYRAAGHEALDHAVDARADGFQDFEVGLENIVFLFLFSLDFGQAGGRRVEVRSQFA